MLGEQIAELTGKVIGTRVLPGDDYRYVKMEFTVQQSGQLYGTPVTDFGTYTVFERVPGQIFGEGQGITETDQGEGAIWRGHGIGRMLGQGMAMAFRVSLAYQAGGEGKLGPLNQSLIIGEHEVDADGNTRTRLWEWK
jgi:hypothetical protein